MTAVLRVPLFLSLALWAAAFGAGGASAESSSPPNTKAFKAVAAREASGILRVEATTPAGKLVGAGIVVGPTLVVSVEHLVHGATAVLLERGGKAIGTGTVIGADPAADLALIQSDTPLAGFEFKLSAASPKLGAGVAILGGSPVAATPASVDALASVLRVSGASRSGLARTDALVFPSSSGSPIVTAAGVLVGLADVGTKTANGLAYAVTSAAAAPLVAGWEAAPQPIAGALVNGCVVVGLPKPKPDGKLKESLAVLVTGKTYDVIMQTNCGTFTIQLDQAESPNAVASFVELAIKGFFDRTIFHRIIPGFVIQGGDPTGTGEGGPGYETVDTPPANAVYTHGIVAMAKASDEAPGTAGSQFFVVTVPRASLTPDYAIIGKVISGLSIVDKIGLLGVASGQPLQVVELESATVTVS